MKTVAVISLNLWFLTTTPMKAGVKREDLPLESFLPHIKHDMQQDGYWADGEWTLEDLAKQEIELFHIPAAKDAAKIEAAYRSVSVRTAGELWAKVEAFKAIMKQFG